MAKTTSRRHETDQNDEEPQDELEERRDGKRTLKRIVDRKPWLTLPKPFNNLKIRAWLDYPEWLANLWTSQVGETQEQAAERYRQACKDTFLEHDGWEHPTKPGEELPPPSEDEFWDEIPTPLLKAIVTRFNEELEGNPPSRASARATRRR